MASDQGQEDPAWPPGRSGAYDEGEGKLEGDNTGAPQQQADTMFQQQQLQGASESNFGGPQSSMWPGMMQQVNGYVGQGSGAPGSGYAMYPSAMSQVYSMYEMGMPSAMGIASAMPGGSSLGTGLYGMEASQIESAMMQQQQSNYMLQQMLQQQQMMQGYGGQAVPYAASAGGGMNPYYTEQAHRQQPSSMVPPVDRMLNSGTVRKASRARKNKLKPKRPLSAYNIFFKDERAKLLAEADAKSKDCSDSDEAEKNDKADSDEIVKKEDDSGKTEDKGDDSNKAVDKGDDSNNKTGKEKSSTESEEEKAANIKDKDPPSDKPEDRGDDDKKVSASAGSKKRKREPHGKVSFEKMAKIVGARWKQIDEERLAYYKKKAEEDMVRYKKEMNEYLEKQRKGLEDGHDPEATAQDESQLNYLAFGGTSHGD